jgi:hypothetical protein
MKTRATLLIAVLLLCFITTPAPAEEDLAPTLEVQITKVYVSGSTPADRVKVTATITNTGSVAAYGVQAYLWRSADPITDTDTLRDAAGRTGSWGARMIPGDNRFKLITNSVTAFAPGESVTVKLWATLAELGFTEAGAVYPIGVQVLGTPDMSSNYTMIGSGRHFVPIGESQRVPVTEVVLLSSTPTKLAANIFANDRLSGELGGRLAGLLDLVGGGRSFLIDPALLDEITDMADGYLVVGADGLVPGTGQQLAADWLARFQQLAQRLSGAQLLFASPSLSSDPSIQQRALSLLDADSGLPLVVVPTDLQVTITLAQALAAFHPAAVIATNTSSSEVVQDLDGVKVLTPTQVPDLDAQTQQDYLLAEAFLAGSAGQLRLIREVEDAQAWEGVTAAWLFQRPLAQLLEQTASRDAELTEAKQDLLSKTQLKRVNAAAKQLQSYCDLVPETVFTAAEPQLLARATSAWWVGNDSGQKQYLEALDQLIGKQATAKGVSLQASPRFVMSAQQNQFPVTVTNLMTETIRVKVATRSLNPQRLRVPDTDVVSIAPGVSQTVNISPQASSNGVIEVYAYVATEGGVAVSAEVPISISVTNLSAIGWIIIAASGTALIILTALRIRQRSRERTIPEAPHE